MTVNIKAPKIRNDLIWLNSLCHFGKIFYVVPFHLKETYSTTTTRKIFSLLLCILTAVITWLSIQYRKTYYEHILTPPQKFIDILQVLIECLLVESIIFGNIYHEKGWRKLFVVIPQVESAFDSSYKLKIKMRQFRLRTVPLVVVFVSLNLYDHLVWEFDKLKDVYNIPAWAFKFSIVNSFYLHLNTILLVQLLGYFRDRYKFLNRKMSCIFAAKNAFQPESFYITELQEISKIYGHLNAAVKYFNSIFGISILLSCSSTIIVLINCITITAFNTLVGNTMLVENLMNPAMSSGLIVMVITYCNLVRKSGCRLESLCYDYQNNFRHSNVIRQELYLLAKFAEKKKPEFTAAGFYALDKTVLSMVVSTVVTYLIVISQFSNIDK